MTVVLDAVGPNSTGTATTGNSLSWSHTCSGTNRLLTVSLSVGSGTTATVTSVTYNGVAMTEAARVMSNNQNDGYVKLFYLVAPATGSNTVQVTCDSSKPLIAGSVSFTGVDQTTPVSNLATNFGSSASPSVTVSSKYGNMVVTALCNGSNINSSNKDDQWKRNFNTLSAAGNGMQSTAYGTPSVSFTYSVSNDWWGVIGLNINASPINTNPDLISVTSVTDYMTAGTPKSVSLTTQAGDLVVVYGGGEDNTDLLGTPSGNGISFTLHQSVVTASYSTAYIWSGVDSTGGTNWTLQTALTAGSGRWGFTALVFRDHGGAGNSSKTNAIGTPSLGLTTAGDNSAIVVFNIDASTADGSSRAWLSVNGITPTAANLLETNYTRSSIAYALYGGYYYDAGTAGANTVGLSTPSQTYAIVALEVRAPIVVPPTATIAWFTV